MSDESESISNPHDALIKRTFGSVEHAEGELRAVLPPAIVDAIDWSTLSLQPQRPVNEELRERHIDLLYRVVLRDHPTYLYTVFEAQRTVDKTMPLRLLIYMSRIWDDWLRTRGEEGEPSWPPPPILPIVLYHGEGSWKRSRQFSDMFEVTPQVNQVLGPYLPRFEFLLDDLTRVSDEELLARALTNLARLVLGALKHGTEPSFGDEFLSIWQEPIRALLAQDDGSSELRTIMWYLLQVNPAVERDTLGAMMMESFGQEAEQAVLTAGQRMLRDSRLEGRQEGRQEGRVALLLELLQHRFGPLAAEITNRVQTADSHRIDRWAASIIDAKSLDEVFVS